MRIATLIRSGVIVSLFTLYFTFFMQFMADRDKEGVKFSYPYFFISNALWEWPGRNMVTFGWTISSVFFVSGLYLRYGYVCSYIQGDDLWTRSQCAFGWGVLFNLSMTFLICAPPNEKVMMHIGSTIFLFLSGTMFVHTESRLNIALYDINIVKYPEDLSMRYVRYSIPALLVFGFIPLATAKQEATTDFTALGYVESLPKLNLFLAALCENLWFIGTMVYIASGMRNWEFEISYKSPDDVDLGAETDVILQIAAQKDYSRIKHEL